VPRSARWSGWLIGAVCGVLASLWAFPAVRYTLTAQMQFALAEDTIPWISSLDAQRTAREEPRLDLVASRHPDDYLLQVGRATAQAVAGGIEEAVQPGSKRGLIVDRKEIALARLGAVTRAFATTPGAYAHFARYLMSERVRIQRAELAVARSGGDNETAPTETITPSVKTTKIMLWALRSGERLDPENAFWPAMLAATHFAASQDDNAIEALARASRKIKWESYIYEEVLGQWRLYSAAYGDHGATQQIGPLSLVVFPHLYEIRRMAEMARWRADRFAAQGNLAAAARIRHNLARLGVNLRENAGWAFEALYGTDLFFIACTDLGSNTIPSRIRTTADWEPHAVGYHRLLQDLDREYEFRNLRSEVQNSCDLRKRVDLARYAASDPGIPPGIPLMPLFGNWMAGICLVQQALGLLVAMGATTIWARFHNRKIGRTPLRTVGLVLLIIATAASGIMFLTTMSTPRIAGLLLIGLTILSIAGLESVARALPALRSYLNRLFRRDAVLSTPEDALSPGDLTAAMERAAYRWSRGTTMRMLIFIVAPYLVILYVQRGELSGLHPVAILLTSLIGVPHPTGIRDSIELASLGSALPLAVPLCGALWGLYRGQSPLAGALLSLRRLAIPCLVCLVAAYAVLLNRMLVLDAEASQAIQKAAQNDRQWVLTHGAENPF
jgi:hypothetical protein